MSAVATAADVGRSTLHRYFPDQAWYSRPDFELAHWPIGVLIDRGCRDGVFDPELSTDWIVRVLWYLMAAGSEAVAEGTMAKHEATANIGRIVEGGIRMPRERD